MRIKSIKSIKIHLKKKTENKCVSLRIKSIKSIRIHLKKKTENGGNSNIIF